MRKRTGGTHHEPFTKNQEALAMSRRLPLAYFREALEKTRTSIINNAEQFQDQCAGIRRYVLEDMTFYDTTAFGQTLHKIVNDLAFMSHLFGA